jgi:hypothetical protein
MVIINFLPTDTGQWTNLINNLCKLPEEKKQVYVLSCYSTAQIIEMVDDHIQTIGDENTRHSLLMNKDRLIAFFSKFTSYYPDNLPYKLPDKLKMWISEKFPDQSEAKEILTFAEKELKFVDFAGGGDIRLKKILYDQQDYQVIKSGFYDLFKHKYDFIWSRCTLNEKIILFDLVIDSVVNTKNREVIDGLILKGILEVSGKLDFVSRGFKQYVNDLSGTGEFTMVRAKEKSTNGWSRIKLPIYITLGAVILFFFFMVQDAVTDILKMIISIGGLLTAVWKLGIFGKPAQAEH